MPSRIPNPDLNTRGESPDDTESLVRELRRARRFGARRIINPKVDHRAIANSRLCLCWIFIKDDRVILDFILADIFYLLYFRHCFIGIFQGQFTFALPGSGLESDVEVICLARSHVDRESLLFLCHVYEMLARR